MKIDRNKFVNSVVLAAVLLGSMNISACTSSRNVQATIVDESGRPIPGALLYYEAYKHPGAFDFGYAVAGQNGEVPGQGMGPIKISWRFRAKIAFAAFAPGKKPTVIRSHTGIIPTEGMTIPLLAPDEQNKGWEPSIPFFSFPFEDNEELAQRAVAPEAAPLRRAFLSAYAPLITGKVRMLPREKRKIDLLLHTEKQAL